MGKLVGDHIMSKRFGAFGQTAPEHNATATASHGARGRHPQRPALTRHVVFLCDAKPRIIEEIALNGFRQLMQYSKHAISQRLAVGKRFHVGREDFRFLLTQQTEQFDTAPLMKWYREMKSDNSATRVSDPFLVRPHRTYAAGERHGAGWGGCEQCRPDMLFVIWPLI